MTDLNSKLESYRESIGSGSKEKSYQAYKAECKGDKRLVLLSLITCFVLCGILVSAMIWSNYIMLCFPVAVWVSIRSANRIFKSVRDKYLYL